MFLRSMHDEIRPALIVLRLLPSASPPLAAAVLIVAVLQPAFGLGFTLSASGFVSQIPHVLQENAAGLQRQLLLGLAAVAIFYLGLQLATSLRQVLQSRLGRCINDRLEERLASALLSPTGIGHLEDAETRDVAQQAVGGLGAQRWRPAEMPGALASLLSSALALLAYCALVAVFRWWLGVLLCAVAAWAVRELAGHTVRTTMAWLDGSGLAEMRRITYEFDQAIAPESAKEIRLFGFASWLLDRVAVRHVALLRHNLPLMARLRPTEIVALTALCLVTTGGFVLVGVEGAQGHLSLDAAIISAWALLMPVGLFGGILQALVDIKQCGKPITNLVEVRQRLQVAEAESDQGALPPSDLLRPDIRLEEVTFRYPGGQEDVLHSLCLEIPAGRSLAIVGANGAGKTTLLNLLCRFYEPTAGRIMVDGTDLRQMDPEAWQRRVAAIFQDFVHYPLSARDNVRFGCLSADEQRLNEAARMAGLAPTLERLPQGWNTPLSREFSDGADLSGGEWQRVALARAMLAAACGAVLLILDEPAANLDVRGEAELNEHFLELTRGLTTIVISHRFPTVRWADQICVLDGGKIAERGSHTELLEANGRYAYMYKLQATTFEADNVGRGEQ